MARVTNKRAQKLGELTDKALDKVEAILDENPERHDPETGEVNADPRILAVQARVVDTVLRTQMQADHNALRQESNDKLDELLRLLRDPTLPVPSALEHQPADIS